MEMFTPTNQHESFTLMDVWLQKKARALPAYQAKHNLIEFSELSRTPFSLQRIDRFQLNILEQKIR